MFLAKEKLIKKIWLLTLPLVFVFVLGACSSNDRIKGNGKMTYFELPVTDSIKKIDISKVSATLNITSDKNDNLTYSIDENLKDLLYIEANDGTLKITSNESKNILGYDNKIVFNVGTDVLEELYIYGDVIVNGEGMFVSDTLNSNVEGTAKLNLNINVENTIINVNGAADITLSGATNELKIKSEGATKIKTRELFAQVVSINFSGAGSMEVYANKKLDVSGQGISSVKYWGSAELTGSPDGIASVKKGE